MRATWPLIALLLLAFIGARLEVSPSRMPLQPNHEVISESMRATDLLRERCRRSGVNDRDIPVVRVILEQEGPTARGFISGLRFEIVAKGRTLQRLTFGSVGVGTSAEDAHNTATGDWMELVGAQYCAAISGAPGGISVGTLTVYPSAIGIRGKHPGGWLTDREHVSRKILDAIPTALTPVENGEVGLIDVKVMIAPGASRQGECCVNGRVSDAACRELLSLLWPPGVYVYKQAFVYRANVG